MFLMERYKVLYLWNSLKYAYKWHITFCFLAISCIVIFCVKLVKMFYQRKHISLTCVNLRYNSWTENGICPCFYRKCDGAFSHDCTVSLLKSLRTRACMHTVRWGFEIKSLKCELLLASCLVTLVKLFYLSKL